MKSVCSSLVACGFGAHNTVGCSNTLSIGQPDTSECVLDEPKRAPKIRRCFYASVGMLELESHLASLKRGREQGFEWLREAKLELH